MRRQVLQANYTASPQAALHNFAMMNLVEMFARPCRRSLREDAVKRKSS